MQPHPHHAYYVHNSLTYSRTVQNSSRSFLEHVHGSSCYISYSVPSLSDLSRIIDTIHFCRHFGTCPYCGLYSYVSFSSGLCHLLPPCDSHMVAHFTISADTIQFTFNAELIFGGINYYRHHGTDNTQTTVITR